MGNTYKVSVFTDDGYKEFWAGGIFKRSSWRNEASGT